MIYIYPLPMRGFKGLSEAIIISRRPITSTGIPTDGLMIAQRGKNMLGFNVWPALLSLGTFEKESFASHNIGHDGFGTR